MRSYSSYIYYRSYGGYGIGSNYGVSNQPYGLAVSPVVLGAYGYGYYQNYYDSGSNTYYFIANCLHKSTSNSTNVAV